MSSSPATSPPQIIHQRAARKVFLKAKRKLISGGKGSDQYRSGRGREIGWEGTQGKFLGPNRSLGHADVFVEIHLK